MYSVLQWAYTDSSLRSEWHLVLTCIFKFKIGVSAVFLSIAMGGSLLLLPHHSFATYLTYKPNPLLSPYFISFMAKPPPEAK